MPKIIENKLIAEFKEKEAFSREELYSFFSYYEPDLKENTLAWRIYDLREKGIIRTVKRGWYTISFKPKYKPIISAELQKISKLMSERFQDLKYCVWETAWLNEFLQHQSSKFIVIVEIEKGFEQELYFYLKDNFKHEVYLNPHEKEINYYIAESQLAIVTKKLITRSPIAKQSIKNHKVYFPHLEKILVDLFYDEKLFYLYHGSEMIYLFENAFKYYSINYTRLFSYAKRRDKEERFMAYLNKNLEHVIIDISE